MTRILVTGASGFVGSAICEALVARGLPVTGLDRRPSPFMQAPFLREMDVITAETGDTDALRHHLAGRRVTHVVHAAALTPDAHMETEAPDRIMAVNVAATCGLMASARAAGVERLMFLSSIAIYGAARPSAGGRFHESDSPQPETLYGISKGAAEQALGRLARLGGPDLQIVRLGPLFGPFEHAGPARSLLSPHHQITEAARTGCACVLPRAVPADWLYARDAGTRIADLLLAPTQAHSTFNLGGGTITTLMDWCAALAAHLPGFRWRVDAAASTVRYGYATDRPALDMARLDAVSAPRTTSLPLAAADYLAWLERFTPLPLTSEFSS